MLTLKNGVGSWEGGGFLIYGSAGTSVLRSELTVHSFGRCANINSTGLAQVQTIYNIQAISFTPSCKLVDEI